MTQSLKSQHAKQLIELGFEQYDESSIGGRSHRTDKTEIELLPDEFPIQVFVPFEIPCFMTLSGDIEVTVAVDETDQLWIHRHKRIDLTQFGFSPMLQTHTLQ